MSYIKTLALVLLISASVAQAADGAGGDQAQPLAEPMSFAQHLAIQRKIDRMELQLQQDELEAKLQKAKAAAQDDGATGVGSPLPSSPTAHGQAGAARRTLPAASDVFLDMFQFTSLYGVKGRYVAELSSLGKRFSVRVGNHLPGGWTVRSIDLAQVVLERRGVQKAIPFSASSTPAVVQDLGLAK